MKKELQQLVGALGVGVFWYSCYLLGGYYARRRERGSDSEDIVIIRDGISLFERHPDIPPSNTSQEDIPSWVQKRTIPMKTPDPTLTSRDRWLLRLSMTEYVEARRSGKFTCEEYTTLVVKRAMYYRYMNQWTARCYHRFNRAIKGKNKN